MSNVRFPHNILSKSLQEEENIWDNRLAFEGFSKNRNIIIEILNKIHTLPEDKIIKICDNKLEMDLLSQYSILKDDFPMFVAIVHTNYYDISYFSQYLAKCSNPIPYLDLCMEKGYVLTARFVEGILSNNNLKLWDYILGMKIDATIKGFAMFVSSGDWKNVNAMMVKSIVEWGYDIEQYSDYMLQEAISYNNLDVVKFIIETFGNTNIDKHLRMASNNLKMLKYLISQGANIHSLNPDRVCFSNFEVVKFLFDLDYNIPSDILNSGLLWIFVNNNAISDIEYLLGHGADINYILFPPLSLPYAIWPIIRSESWNLLPSCLEYVVSIGKLDHVKFLMDNYYSLMALEIDKIFMIACANGQIEIATYIFNFNPKFDGDALMFACFFGHLSIVEYLLGLGLTFSDFTLEEPFKIVSRGYESLYYGGGCRLYNEIIKDNPNFKNDAYIFGKDHRKIIKLLMKYEVKLPLNIELDLEFIHLLNFPEILESLLHYGLNHDKLESIFLKAIWNSNITKVKLLLEHGVKFKLSWPHICDKYGKYNERKINIDEDMKQLLLAYGYDL